MGFFISQAALSNKREQLEVYKTYFSEIMGLKRSVNILILKPTLVCAL